MRSASDSPVPIMNVAVDSTPSPCATSITCSHTSPGSLSGAIACRGRSHEDLRAGPGERVQPRGVQAADHLLEGQPRHLRDVHDLAAPSECSASCG